MKKTLRELAELVGGRLEGDGARRVSGVASLAEAGPEDIAFVAVPRYKAAAAASKAACLIVPQKWRSNGPAALLKVADPNRAMATIAAVLCPPLPQPKPGIHPQAVVAPSAVLGKGVHVGASAVVGERVRLGDRTRVRAGAVVADEATVGADCDIHSAASSSASASAWATASSSMRGRSSGPTGSGTWPGRRVRRRSRSSARSRSATTWNWGPASRLTGPVSAPRGSARR